MLFIYNSIRFNIGYNSDLTIPIYTLYLTIYQVRFLAQHSAIAYFFVLIFLWFASPSLAYNFSQLIEAHAVDTYAEFAESNKEVCIT